LPDDVFRCYKKAGRIAKEVREEATKIVMEGASVLQVCETIEKLIRDKGGRLAFPCNICINEVAAHYSPPPGEKRVVPIGSLVSVDLGVHVEGYIADTAISIGFGPDYDDMINATNDALEQAINTLRPGIKLSDVGRVVQKTIERYGFKPIRNLSGHQVARYAIHTGKSIPNVSGFDGSKISEGEVCAIEPFVTTPSAKGEVRGLDEAYIFRFQRERAVKDANVRMLLKEVKSRFKTLPFSERWLRGILPDGELDLALSELLSNKSVVAYPVLVESSGNVVAQAEHTAIITRDGCVPTTI